MKKVILHNLLKKMQKFAFKLFLCFLFTGYFFSANVKQANAMTINYGDEACGITYNGTSKTQKAYNPLDTDETKQTVDKLNKSIEKLKKFCDKLSAYTKGAAKRDKNIDENVFPTQTLTFGGWKPETADEYQTRFQKIMKQNPSFQKEYETLKNEYNRLNEELETARQKELAEHNHAKQAGEYQPCGDKYPRGCPEGMECYAQTGSITQGTFGSYSTTTTTYTCKRAEDVKKPIFGDKPKPVEQGTDTSSVVVTTAGLSTTTVRTDETGKTTIGAAIISNTACNIADMRKNYQSSCYSCIIIKTLITTFMDACAKVQDITTEAGIIILQVALMLWLMFFVLKQISSFTNIEPGSMINTLFITLFKCLVAYVFITSGVSAFTTYIIEPLMDAGASYGIGLMKSSPAHLELTPQTTVTSKGTSIVSARLINNIMGFTESLDKTVSTNLIIGHALTCHSFHAGMWQWDAGIMTIKIPNIWIWLCGAAIWFCGFMLTLGIGYYLLDISFKLGFAIIAFPVVAALWPFDVTKDKFQKCVSIVLKSAATFTMLAMTASYALVLVSSSLRNLDEFFERIEAGDSDWIADTFDITGSYFIIIIFAYLYSLKLISSTINDYVNQFFPDGVMGNQTPMHHQLTRITDMAKQKAMKPISYARDVVSHQTGRLGGALTRGAIKGVVKGAKFVKNKITGGNKSQKSSSNNTDKQNN